MSNIFIENDTYIMWTGRKFNKGWLNPRDEMGRFTSVQRKTIKKCKHKLKRTFCGDGCKEHPGVWVACVNKCGYKRRVI